MTDTFDSTVSAIRETTILVSMHGGFFQWKNRDREIERTVAAQRGLNSNVGQYYKNIFAGADNLLDSTKALITEARAYHYDKTLPSPYEGEAFLRNILIAPYKAAMIGFQHRLEALNQQIGHEWPTMLATAKATLGPMFNARDYPTVEEVYSKNYITVNFKPIPDGANMIVDGIDEDLRQEIASSVDSQVREAFKAANLTAWKRLLDVIANANVNLQKDTDGNSRFRTEWLDNLAGLLQIMDGLNITGDADLHDFSQQAHVLLKYSADALKQNGSKREELAETADKLFRDMSSMYANIGGK